MFKRLFAWLEDRFLDEKPADVPVLRQSGVRPPPRVRPRPAPPKPRDESYSPDEMGSIEDGGPGKNVLIRNKYVREETGTHDNLKILDDSILESDDEAGADPYNTGRFDRSQSWNLRSRK